MRRSLLAALLLSLSIALPAQSKEKPDAATQAWWNQTVALSNDKMEGRDTGTEAYERAAKYVADQFQSVGLKPAGDNGTFFQRVPMHQTDLDLAHSSVEIKYFDPAQKPVSLKLLEEVTINPRQRIVSNFTGPLVFLGYGDNLPAPNESFLGLKSLAGVIAVIYNGAPAELSTQQAAALAARRSRALAENGVSAILSIDNPAATEPSHWPVAYARSVVIQPGGAAPPPMPKAPAPLTPFQMRISPEAAAKLFAGTPEHSFSDLLRDGEKGLPLPTFRLQAGLEVAVRTLEKDISSPNILAILPGSDPKLASEYVALSAHLDGYGYGTPVLGDNLYNGTLDDAAYVALLIELANSLQHHPPARSLLFCIFTGEEKGLLGSAYFTQHLTVPKENIVADLNLDQLRPIFPLNILTMEGITDSTLGETVRTVAAQFKIEIRPDLEPERRLFSRADNYNFVRIGVPIASFIFGYDKGSPEEVTYRDWYARRYHKPQDDIKTPIDWPAAAEFNAFYKSLAVAIANAPTRPQWLPASSYAPHQSPAQ
jgi:hypothetical protein